MFVYSSVLGVILYLSGDTFPDVDLDVNSFDRYMFSPKLYHELELNR